MPRFDAEVNDVIIEPARLSLDPRMDWVRFGCRDEESAF
ncbi:hypothetical protein I546_7154 [Mycobacterium kansasii 732]|nr:hypothetical protein I546_7154 [Mycobacterium kansasii 732]